MVKKLNKRCLLDKTSCHGTRYSATFKPYNVNSPSVPPSLHPQTLTSSHGIQKNTQNLSTFRKGLLYIEYVETSLPVKDVTQSVHIE